MLNSTDKIIKHKTGLLNLAEELGNVSKACQVMARYQLQPNVQCIEWINIARPLPGSACLHA